MAHHILGTWGPFGSISGVKAGSFIKRAGDEEMLFCVTCSTVVTPLIMVGTALFTVIIGWPPIVMDA